MVNCRELGSKPDPCELNNGINHIQTQYPVEFSILNLKFRYDFQGLGVGNVFNTQVKCQTVDLLYVPFIDPTLYVLYKVKRCRLIHLIIPRRHQKLFEHFLNQCTFFCTTVLKLYSKCKCDSIYKKFDLQYFRDISIVFSQFLQLQQSKRFILKC